MELRMIEREAGTRVSFPSFNMSDQKPDGFTWYDSISPTQDKTAGYLQRLSHLHQNLIQSETIQISKIVNSFPKLNQSGSYFMRRKPAPSISMYDSAPSLHARKQLEKMEVIDRRRRAALKSPPPLTIGVRQIADPERLKQKYEKKEPPPPKDPFDPANLEPDPIERLFSLERLRLINAEAEAKKNKALVEVEKKSTIKVRQKDLLTPRRGTEWFVTGRYKREPRKLMRARIPRHKKDRAKKAPQKPPKLSASNSLKNEKSSDGKFPIQEVEASMREGAPQGGGTEHEGGTYNVPTTTPIQWGPEGPNTEPADSTTNIMLAIASTAEANKAETKTRSFHYDPNNYRPIGTPKTSPKVILPPTEATSSTSSMTKYDDLRRSKAIAAVLQGSVNENGESYSAYESTTKKRHNSEQNLKFQKALNINLKVKGAGKLEATIKVPVSNGPSEGLETGRGLQEGTTKLEVVSLSPSSTSKNGSDALFVPARPSQPQIVLRHSSPDLISLERVPLNKIVRQNELRHRELGNLFEDIKELNRVSETLEKNRKAEINKKTEN